MEDCQEWKCSGIVAAIGELSRLRHIDALPFLLKALEKPPTLRNSRFRVLLQCTASLIVLTILCVLWASGDQQDGDAQAVIDGIKVFVEALVFLLPTIALGIVAVTEANNADIRLAAVKAIGEIGDKRAIQPLLTMLDQSAVVFPSKYLIPSLVPCLESLGTEDEAYIDAESERIIGKMLAWDTLNCRTCLALLYALRFAVTSASIASVRSIIERGLPHASDADNRRVLAAAVEVLPIIEERKRLADQSNQLLRAGYAPTAGEEELVRPVLVKPGSDDEAATLMRPTSEQEAVKQRL